MNLIFESDLKLQDPFFSVCIETYNRGKTIFRALESILNQEFKNFECIVVDDLSDDETISEIQKFISSPAFVKSPFSFKLYQNKTHLGGVLNWNSPLKLAIGKYISVLEGDDYFLKEHLKKANAVLDKKPRVGIYGTGSQRALRPRSGAINSKEYFQYTYQLINISPPSETIFIRLNKSKEPFLYNVVDYTYAPEIELLLAISDNGWDGYHTSDSDVYREPSTSFTNMTWKFFDDKFKIVEKYRTHKYIDAEQYKKVFRRQMVLSVRRYLVSDYQQKGNPESLKKGIWKVLENKNDPSFYKFLFSVVLFLNSIYFFKLYFKLKKIT